tara:strand:+ start:17178 stop:17348 length:171 start_codon:yes stop_codon:yes gene_type:complete
MVKILIGLGAIAFGVISIWSRDMQSDYGFDWMNSASFGVIYGIGMILLGIALIVGA